MRKRLFALWARLEKHWLWPLLALLCLSTSLWVVHLVKTGVGLPLAIAQGLFYSLQFIVLNKQIDDISTGWLLFGLTFAQFALPLLASSVVLGGLFRAHMQPIWIRRFATSDLSGHHIVLGYGDLGKALVNQLILARQHVVAIDIQETDRQASDGLTILQGDARSPIEDLFAGSQLPKARCLYLMLPDESANLDLLARLQAYITCSKHSSGRALSIYVRTETHALGQLFTDWVGLDSTHGQAQLDIRPINPYDIVARDVVNRYSPDCYVPTCRSGPIAQTIMIVGTSRMAQALLLRFTRIGIYAPHGKLRMVWVGDDVVEAFAALSADYPLLDAEHYPPAFWGADAATDPEY